jgi:hypothetical protein
LLGVMTAGRWTTRWWPRFLNAELHRNVSLLVIAVLVIHIVTAELDTFAPVGWLAVVVPFASAYRPLWLGLGTVAFDLLLALVISSLLRHRIGHRTWRAVHWAAYLSWPVAVVHGLGTGSDARTGWVQVLTAVCASGVLLAVAARLATGWRQAPRLCATAAAAVVATIVGVSAWATSGPFQPGWAKRSDTPPTLLASSPAATGSPSRHARRTGGGSTGVPATSHGVFTSGLRGSLHQAGPTADGEVVITMSTRLVGTVGGVLDVTLEGQAAGGGVTLQTSVVKLMLSDPLVRYVGQVTLLNGDQIAASVAATSGQRLSLSVDLIIGSGGGSVRGTVAAQDEHGGDG